MAYSSRALLKMLLKDVWKEDKVVYVENFLYTLFFVFYSGLSVFVTKLILDYLGRADASVVGFVKMILLYLLVAGISGFLFNYFGHSSYARMTYLRLEQGNRVLEKLHGVDYYHTEDTSFQAKLQHALEAFSGNNQGFEGILQAIYSMVPHLVLAGVFLAYLSKISVFIVVAILVNSYLLFRLKKKASEVYYESQDERNQLSRQRNSIERVAQDAAFGKDLRMYSMVHLMQKEITSRLDLILGVMKKERRRSNRWLLPGVITVMASEAVVYGLLLKNFFDGGSIGQLVMVFTLMTRLAVSLEMIQMKITTFYENLSTIRDYLSFVETDYGEVERRGEFIQETPSIEFKNVSFSYPGSDNEVLKDVSFTLRPGERIGIVGTNGAGKTTLIKLMLGFYPLSKGEILIGGKSVKDYASGDLYDLYNVVFQENILYGFNIAENIAMTDADIDEEKVLWALDEVEMKEKVLGYKHGLKQPVLKVVDEEGVEFSGGEKQKLCIARALYKGGEIMILDEPTSALDAVNEAKVYENYNKMIKDKTAIFISHRLASTRFCHRIFFFDQGKLLEAGTHDELMDLEGRYYDMFMVQSKYYREEEEHVSRTEAVYSY